MLTLELLRAAELLHRLFCRQESYNKALDHNVLRTKVDTKCMTTKKSHVRIPTSGNTKPLYLAWNLNLISKNLLRGVRCCETPNENSLKAVDAAKNIPEINFKKMIK